MQLLTCKIVGVAPLLMHNGLLADPAYSWTLKMKEVTSKRKKSAADYDEMARIEWNGSLYLLEGAPCIPGVVLEGALLGRGGAARTEKMGKVAAASMRVMKDFPLIYEGPSDLVELWNDPEFRFQAMVKVQMARVKRTRPMFKEWAAFIEIEYDEDFIDASILERWLIIAGKQVGLMDWRPKYGRFKVEQIVHNSLELD